MSRPIQRAEDTILGLESGFASLRSNPEFTGPAESVAEHESYDHLALVYENADDQFETAIPFMAAGLERGERCLYIADENEIEDVTAALRTAGVDVESALESGALTMHTATDSYLRNGTFDPDDMIAFLSDAIEEANDEFDGLRITGEMTWVLGDDPSIESLVEYESKLNTLLPETNGIALCQYNRERFSPEIIRDIIKTHPHLVYDRTVCQNFYYTPPEEFFGPDQPARETDRMIGTLVDRTEARVELQSHREHLQRQNEITGDPDRSFEEKLQQVFELGCDRFDLELGAVARVDTDEDWFEVEYVSDEHPHFEPGVELPLSETYCAAATEIKAANSVSNPVAEGYDDSHVYAEFDIRAYLGTYLEVEGGPDRTFFFVTSDQREDGFSEEERTFQHLLGQWVTYELEREQRERNEQALYEIAANTEWSFEEKTQRLFELGCDRFGLELGVLARIDPTNDSLEVEAVSGEHEHLRPGAQAPLSETYCRLTVDDEEIADVTAPADQGFEGTIAYDEFGIETYLGTRIELEGSLDRTFFFVSSESRDRPFSDAEETFHHLMGQWMKYELEREQRERALEASNERLEQFAYAASHDLQEPLRMVTSYLQLIEQRNGDALDADGEEFLEFATDGANRMRSMIDGLLEYSRVETQGDPLEPIKLDDVLEHVLEDLQIRIEEHDAEITVEELPRVLGDASQLRQVFQNLLSNAITYSGDEPPRVRVDARRRGQEWEISVRDEGIGIAPEDQDRVFTVFDRLHSLEEYEGTGIGLALCQRIVERHGGDIRVDSEPGEGSTFTLTLPVPDR
ncbi:MEDS domain-containing protein [Natronorubrum halophilum]|uniref:MEDS domain-containing protein n=1 Tax=Natronorubrum halophilum TaxID=1702106 RepID=UPI0010C1DB40|nr:MEDS domain-containing protein [Natronorubrum halophilum]